MFFSAGSRGAFIAVIMGYLITKISFKDAARPFLQKTISIAFSGLFLYIFLFHIIPYILYPDSGEFIDKFSIRATTHDRISLWLIALHFIENNPFLGIGPMHYAWHEGTQLATHIVANHPHNSLLQWGAEWGLVSLFLVVFLIFQGYKAWFKKFNYCTLMHTDEKHNQLIIALTFSSSSAIIYSLVSGVIVMPMSQLMGVFVLSMMLGVYNNKKIYLKDNKSIFNFLLIPVAILYLYLLLPDIINIFLTIDNTDHSTRYIPRFWKDGSIGST